MSNRIRILGALANPLKNNKFEIIGNCSDLDRVGKELVLSRFTGKKNDLRFVSDSQELIAVVGLGEKKEISTNNVRLAIAKAVKSIKALDGKVDWKIQVQDFSKVLSQGAEIQTSIAEGSTLANYSFDQFKEAKKRSTPVSITSLATTLMNEWREGEILGQSQNLARELKETPANLMTPTIFCERATALFKDCPNVEIRIRDREWALEQKMGAFVSVSNGSAEPLKFLEIVYSGSNRNDDAPLALVGKGVTFDSGGISIKPSSDMAMMKGDMGGAAVVLSSLWGIVQMGLELNVVAVMPLTENMPSGTATKPGDLVTAANGLTIEVDNTDAEGRLILADAIYYTAKIFNPKALVELSTLTGAMDVALGEGYAGVFATHDELWATLEKAGKVTGDQFWRMPLSKVYASQIESKVADLKNVGGRSAGSCTAALFLKAFVPEKTPFAHIDIAGVMHTRSDPLLSPGMTGRPTRSIVEFAKKVSAGDLRVQDD